MGTRLTTRRGEPVLNVHPARSPLNTWLALYIATEE
jgi:hypothetical protein